MALDDLGRIVGEANFTKNPAALQEYCEGKGGCVPRALVRPASTEEVQRIVEWANDTRALLVPVSSGPPHIHGGSTPSVEGAVVVDLRRMDKVIRVDKNNRVVIVQPGVTFGHLQTELARQGLSAYLPLLPRPTKSVLASVLEREPILMPSVHFDSTDPLLCAEIVFGTGDRMRTGEAAGPDTLEEQWEIGKAQISPFGPTQMDPQRLVSGAQGTIGIVTWVSLKCRQRSDEARAFFLPSEDLDALVELSYHLCRIRYTGTILLLDRVNLARMAQRTPREIHGLQCALPNWVLFVAYEGYGLLPEEKLKYLEEDLRESASSYGLEPVTDLAGLPGEALYRLLLGPSSQPYWKLRSHGGFRDVFFITTQDKTPYFAKRMRKLARRFGFPTQQLGMYMQPVVQGTSCHLEFNLYFDPTDLTGVKRLRRLEAAAVDRLEREGAFFARPYPGWAEAAYRGYPDTAAMQRKVKAIFDPNWVLNPGKLCFPPGSGRQD